MRDVQLDWNDPVRTLKVDLDQDKARALGLTPADIQLVTRTVMNGATLSQLREHEDLIDIVARAVPGERLDLDTLKNVNLFTRQGTVVPLSQVARVTLRARGAGAVAAQPRHGDHRARRREGRRAGRVGRRRRSARASRTSRRSCRPAIASTWAARSRRATRRTRRSLAVAPVMLVTILLILMLQLQSFARMFMVFATAPLGLIGVVAALLLFHAPLGFVAILGIIALGGMIMRNAVILIDQVQTEMDAGQRSVERRGRCGRAPDAPRGAHRRRHGARDGPAHAQRVLGPDGDRDHGRPHRRDAAHDLLRAGSLRGVLQGGATAAAPEANATLVPAY